MKQALAGLALFALGAAVATAVARRTLADAAGTPPAAVETPANPVRYALQAWEGCRPVEAGGAVNGPTTRTLALADGRTVGVSLVPVRRDNGVLVFDTLLRHGSGSSRSQLGVHSMLLSVGLLLRAVDLDGVSREVSGAADYIQRPHPMAR